MAHFIGYLQGSRGDVSRLGTKNSGIDARARGWNIGGRVCVEYDETNDRDTVCFYVDGGSNSYIQGRQIARCWIENGELKVETR